MKKWLNNWWCHLWNWFLTSSIYLFFYIDPYFLDLWKIKLLWSVQSSDKSKKLVCSVNIFTFMNWICWLHDVGPLNGLKLTAAIRPIIVIETQRLKISKVAKYPYFTFFCLEDPFSFTFSFCFYQFHSLSKPHF